MPQNNENQEGHLNSRLLIYLLFTKRQMFVLLSLWGVAPHWLEILVAINELCFIINIHVSSLNPFWQTKKTMRKVKELKGKMQESIWSTSCPMKRLVGSPFNLSCKMYLKSLVKHRVVQPTVEYSTSFFLIRATFFHLNLLSSAITAILHAESEGITLINIGYLELSDKAGDVDPYDTCKIIHV